MSFSVGVDLGGVTVTVAGETLKDMMENYQKMGGDPETLVEAMNETTANWQPGHAAHVFVTGGQLDMAIEDADPETAQAVKNLRSAARHDPWADEPAEEPESDSKPEPSDPWKKGTPVNRNRSAGRSAPSRGNSPHPASRPQRNTGDDGPREVYDRYDNKYVIGLPDAPVDNLNPEHGPMVLKTWTNQAGKTFTAYKCRNQAPGGNYSQKCDAHAWPPR